MVKKTRAKKIKLRYIGRILIKNGGETNGTIIMHPNMGRNVE